MQTTIEIASPLASVHVIHIVLVVDRHDVVYRMPQVRLEPVVLLQQRVRQLAVRLSSVTSTETMLSVNAS